VFKLLEEQTETETEFRFPNIRFFQLPLQDGFLQFPIQPVDSTSQEFEEDEQPTEFEIIPYGISNAPADLINSITHLAQLDAPGQFDEMNPQFFADDEESIAEPSFLYQEL